MENLTWNQYFMELARLSAKRSKDNKTRVGACIIDPETNHILSIGYNGMPYNLPDDDEVWSDENKNLYVVHAEANAILNSKADLTGAVLYTTMFPCNECAKLIAQKRLSKVVYDDDKFRLKPIGRVTEKILYHANIKIEKYSGNN